MQPFLALITPISGGGDPPGIWGGGNVPMPTPPIHMPPGIWGPGSPMPTPPIHMPPSGSPPGIWGPTDPRPGWGLPGQPPGFWGPGSPTPTPPIYFPDDKPPGHWGGGNVPMPQPPIELPPDLPDTIPGDPERPVEWKVGWTSQTGWVVVGIPQVPAPAPSK